MGDYGPGTTWSGDVQTDFGDYGVGVDDAASVWGGRPAAPPRLDPTLANAARVNYSPHSGVYSPYGAALGAEGFGTKRNRFRENEELAARREALRHGLSLAEAGADVLPTAPGAENGDELGGVNGGTTDAWGQMQLGMGREGMVGGRKGVAGSREGFLEGLLADRDVLVLIFVLVLYLVVQSIVDSSVRSALARAGVQGAALAAAVG